MSCSLLWRGSAEALAVSTLRAIFLVFTGPSLWALVTAAQRVLPTGAHILNPICCERQVPPQNQEGPQAFDSFTSPAHLLSLLQRRFLFSMEPFSPQLLKSWKPTTPKADSRTANLEPDHA